MYCVNNRAHMDTVVRCVCAIRRTLLKLAEFHTHLAVQASSAPFHLNPSAFLPYYFGKAYPETTVEQLLSQTKLLFLVTPTECQQRLVKFVPCSKNGAESDTQVHRAWAHAKFAPDLVGTSCCAVLLCNRCQADLFV